MPSPSAFIKDNFHPIDTAKTAKNYFSSGRILNDIVAGLVTGSVLVPQSMSYSLLANVPPQYGIYSSMSLVVYALLGTSPFLSVAPVAMASLLVGGYTVNNTVEEAIANASVIAFYCGIFQMIFGMAQLGTILTTWLSKTMLSGYTTGVALTIIISQLPPAFGVKIVSTTYPIYNLILFFMALPQTKPIAFGFFLVSYIVLYSSGKWLKPWLSKKRKVIADMSVVVTIVVGTGISYALVAIYHVDPKTQLPLVGLIPSGFLPPQVPDLVNLSAPGLIGTAVAIAMVGFSEGYAVAKSLPNSAKVNANREFFAVGSCNMVVSFFNGFVVSGGLSRTMVNINAGAVSQMSGLFAFLVCVLALLFASPAMQYIPKSLLAAIIITAVLGMVKTSILLETFRISKMEFAIAFTTLLFVLAVGPMYAIAYGLAISILFTLYRVAIPHIAELGEMRGILRNIKRYPEEAKRIPHVVVVRVDSPLFFANAQMFFVKCKALIAEHKMETIRVFLVDASGIGFMDVSALHELLKFQNFLGDKGIHLILAEVRGPVRDMIERFNRATKQELAPFYERLPHEIAHDEVTGIDSEVHLSCFSVHSLEEALVEIRAHHLSDAVEEPRRRHSAPTAFLEEESLPNDGSEMEESDEGQQQEEDTGKQDTKNNKPLNLV